MPGSDFRAQKPSKQDKKRLRNIYTNHPKTIVNQYFGFSFIVRFEKTRKHNFYCQAVILGPKSIKTGQKKITKYLRN